jgi:hypothetical protein
MSRNPNSVAPLAKRPLSPVQRSRLYRQRLRQATRSVSIAVSDKWIDGLLRRGYLGENEVDDKHAIEQALTLFIGDLCDRTAPENRRTSLASRSKIP